MSLGILLITGCVSLETERVTAVDQYPEPDRIGVYHKVKQGETIWRIAKTYQVSVDDITRANNIPKAAKIEKGQLVFIPGATSVREIVLDEGDNQKEFIWPVDGQIIKYFHEHQEKHLSEGINIKANAGDQVKAARAGQVVFADYLSGYGFTVILDHSDGFHSVYANNAKLLVKLGDYVTKNMAIAEIGRTDGNLAYLHFQIRKNTYEDNPLYYLP